VAGRKLKNLHFTKKH